MSLRLALAGGARPFDSPTNAEIGPQKLVSLVGIISSVILTMMQVRDLKDQEGDRMRRRKTVVLVLGNVSVQ